MINNNGSINDRKMLDPVTSVLYEPSLSMNDWSYSHHPSVCRFGGRFWAAWSNGETNEDDIGQRVLCAVSRDGVKWEKPWILFDSVPGNHVLTAAGFHTGDNRLIAYAGIYGYTDDNIENGRCVSIGVKHTGTTLLCRSTGDGEIWSDTSDTGIAVVPNQGPQVLNSGRLIICGNIAFPYSDCPDGLQGWTMSGLEPRLQPGMYDDSEGFLIHMKSRRDNRFLC
ncbi:MAG: hypothetical protein PHZ09_03315, partial [Eubacteriales bacterium]|nr:hypothetical protein [Eubacteriales bacterium]